MDPHYENIVKAYQAHCDAISFEDHLNYGVPGTPDLELGLDDKLTVPHSGSQATEGCANSDVRKDAWLATPHPYRDGYNFFSLLGHICTAAKIRECQRKKCLDIRAVMEVAAPACDWQDFRDWAMVAMSCQQALAPDEKQSAAHTHLVNAVFCCLELVGSLDRFPRRTPMAQVGPNTMIMVGVCNVVSWMASIQRHMGLAPRGGYNVGQPFPMFLAGAATSAALKEAEGLAVCKNRLWNMINVSDRQQADLADVVNALRRRPSIRHGEDHQLCSQTRCHGAHTDSTRVEQLHKIPGDDHAKSQEYCPPVVFPVGLLPAAVLGGQATAWSVADAAPPQLLRPGESYVAISHVWSDGTGIGTSGHGVVHNCLYRYFAHVARTLGCGGIWWDTLSNPVEPRVRALALAKMHVNYRNAEYTVVHDAFLAGMPWTDAETACLALVFSPWFTRGWTALELAMSRNVKVLFQGPDPMTPDIRDLETDILGREPATSSRVHWIASQVIRRLRVPARTLESIIAILRPRSTSWVRDRTVIASLLADVPNPDFSVSEGRMIQTLLRHLGSVSHAMLVHGRPTMASSDGFSWCPATLDDMPIDLRHRPDTHTGNINDEMPMVGTDGSVVGFWVARPVSKGDMAHERIQPHGSDISVLTRIQVALIDWGSCLLLYQSLGSTEPALLVTAVGVRAVEGRTEPIIDCRYVGAVRDSRTGERGIINISKFEPHRHFGRQAAAAAADPDDSDDVDEYAVAYAGGSGSRDSYLENLRSRRDPNDDDGDGGGDYNRFHRFQIRLGRDGGEEGTRAWDVLRKAWTMKEAARRAEMEPKKGKGEEAGKKKAPKKPGEKPPRKLAERKKRGN